MKKMYKSLLDRYLSVCHLTISRITRYPFTALPYYREVFEFIVNILEILFYLLFGTLILTIVLINETKKIIYNSKDDCINALQIILNKELYTLYLFTNYLKAYCYSILLLDESFKAVNP